MRIFAYDMGAEPLGDSFSATECTTLVVPSFGIACVDVKLGGDNPNSTARSSTVYAASEARL